MRKLKFNVLKNKDKPERIKSVVPQRIGKVLLWVLVIFLLIRGIGSIVRQSPTIALESRINSKLDTAQSKTEEKNEAASYAVGFVKEYLTYKDGDGEGYRNRIAQYVPDYLVSQISSINTDKNVQATDVNAIAVNYYSDDQINVDVRARTDYIGKTDSSNNTAKNNEVIKYIYIRVPVRVDKGKFEIEDLPVIIAKPENANDDYNSFSGDTVDDTEKAAITNMLGSFLKTYYEGVDNELQYYMFDPHSNAHTVNNGFKLASVDQVNAYKGSTGDERIIIVNFTILDNDSNLSMKQRLNVVAVKKEDKYYVKSFNVRGGNLVIEGSKK